MGLSHLLAAAGDDGLANPHLTGLLSRSVDHYPRHFVNVSFWSNLISRFFQGICATALYLLCSSVALICCLWHDHSVSFVLVWHHLCLDEPVLQPSSSSLPPC